jgi:hypoxanthine phosphoribosyltransferase
MSDAPQKIIFNPSQIQQAVDGIAHEIALWIKASPVRELNLVSVLEGARPFTRDLMARLKVLIPGLELHLQEVRVKGTDGTHLLKERRWQEGLVDSAAIQSRPALLVDDLVDSGLTLKMLKAELLALGATEVKTAVLLRKFGEASGSVDFCGFDLHLNREVLAQKGLKDYWLFGYGMDMDGQQREWDAIGWVEIR